MTPDAVEPVIEATPDEIYQAIKREQRVTLRNFGAFYVRAGRETWTSIQSLAEVARVVRLVIDVQGRV